MAERAYLSIGEVLALLKDEFPEITISKIRFLESQGLLDPERTPSGYRKFYEPDVERLRWILQQQRENFLPLKVIKGRLGMDPGEGPDERTPEEDSPDTQPAPVAAAERPPQRAPEHPVPQPAAADTSPDEVEREAPAPPAPAPPPAAAPPVTPTRTAPAPRAEPAPMPAPAATAGDVSLSRDELAEKVDLSLEQIKELERYGLLVPRHVGGASPSYDGDGLSVAELASAFMRFGVEARHLRMYKNSADREAGFFEQIVMPLMKQRNPEARRQAVDTLKELVSLGEQLRGAMLRDALRDYTD